MTLNSPAPASGKVKCCKRLHGFIIGVSGLLIFGGTLPKTTAQTPAAAHDLVVLFVENRVEVQRAGSQTWDLISTNAPYGVLHPGDHLRTLAHSRAGLRVSGKAGTMILDEFSHVMLPLEQTSPQTTIQVLKGRLFNLHRGRPEELRLQTPTVSAIVRGTEFILQVADDDTTTVSMISGIVEMENNFGNLMVGSAGQGIARPGKAPVRTAAIVSVNLLQWCMYYPGVLSLDELNVRELGSDLNSSVLAYRAGDLLGAVKNWPASRNPQNDSEKIYRASALLAVGAVEEADRMLRQVGPAKSPSLVAPSDLAQSIRRMIAIVNQQPTAVAQTGVDTQFTATGWVVESYHQQSQYRLEQALIAARKAVEKAPGFGFAWERVAELEFGFGRVSAAREALNRALQLTPKNAQAIALHGFLWAADNRMKRAVDDFNRAIALDGALGNGWFGRGLCEFRVGEVRKALDDLEVAAAVEPQRSLFRSYLAKAFSDAGKKSLADSEIVLARKLDVADPTAWFYSGLILYRENQINQSIREMEEAERLNDNRRVFRSRSLLDQDQAVRGANIAAVYRDAGMTNYSVVTAARAVDNDYANDAAHLFLANSYDALRDPRGVDLRYETPWFSELLVANLLAPIGANALSQNVSQQEYSHLLQRNQPGFSSDTEYWSSGDWSQNVSAFGTFGSSSFALDDVYNSFHGDRYNDDVQQNSLYAKFKQQISAEDTLFFQLIKYHDESGDVRDYYDPNDVSRTLRFSEDQQPNIYLGWHRQWSSSSHTLFLAARLQDTVATHDTSAAFPAVAAQSNGPPTFVAAIPGFSENYQSSLQAYSAELQQILEVGPHTLIGGGRAQFGDVNTSSQIGFSPTEFPPMFFGTTNPALSHIDQNAGSRLNRLSVYAYDYWQILDPLRILGGLSYDTLTFPDNADLPPIAGGSQSKSEFSPKIAAIWDITPTTRLRTAYARSLGGSYYDASVRLEPTEIAGFIDTYRSAIPESVAGTVPGSRFEIWGLALDQRLPTETYILAGVNYLASRADRMDGFFNYYPPAQPAQYNEQLRYWEESVNASVSQMIGREWVLSANYNLARASFSDAYPDMPSTLPTDGTLLPLQNVNALLHHLSLQILYNHHSGLFGGLDGEMFSQSNGGYTPDLPGDTFWQCNAAVGWWFAQRRASVRLALLNINNQNYEINPLNLHPYIPRYRTLNLSLHLEF